MMKILRQILIENKIEFTLRGIVHDTALMLRWHHTALSVELERSVCWGFGSKLLHESSHPPLFL